MARRRSAADERRAREAKQKKLLVALVVVFGVVAVIQMPKLTHRASASAAPPPAAAAPAAESQAAAQLPDTDAPRRPVAGKLERFDLFASKDPFLQQVTADAPAAPAGPKPAPAPSSAGGDPFGGAPAPAPEAPRTEVARLSVDGKVVQVAAGGDFPTASPVFHLLSFTADEARVTVVGGSYEDGRDSLRLERGVPVTLQNTADSTTYRLEYLGTRRVAAPPATRQF